MLDLIYYEIMHECGMCICITVLQYSESQRQVFGNHSIATQRLLPALMTIFIDIEFTGESMEFEDKFRK